MGKRKACPECQAFNIGPWISNKMKCRSCESVFHKFETISIEYVPENPTKVRPPNKKLSDKHERHTSRKVGGRMTRASGAVDGDKGDVVVDGLLRIENKTTEKASFGLKLATLEKITGEAKGDEVPALGIEFQRSTGNRRYFVLEEGHFLAFLEAYKASLEPTPPKRKRKSRRRRGIT